MIFEIATSVAFLSLAVWLVWLFLTTSASILSGVHLLFFVLFIPGLHLVGLLGANPLVYDPVLYVTTHVIALLYIVVFLIVVRLTRALDCGDRLISHGTFQISDYWLVIAFCTWLLVKTYLIYGYGVSAFATYKVIAGDDAIQQFKWWEKAADSISATFAVGAALAYVTKALNTPKYWAKFYVTTAFLAFMVPFVVALESIVGSRRLILGLAIAGFLSMAKLNETTFLELIRARFRQVCFALACALLVMVYYQAVRDNVFRSDTASRLLSSDPLEVVGGAAIALVPSIFTGEEVEETVDAERTFFREGPFELLYRIVEKRLYYDLGTELSIVEASFEAMVPRVIAGDEKRVVDADEIILEKLDIVPDGPFLVPDFATSITAILAADLGTIMSTLAPLIVIMGLWFCARLGTFVSGGPWLLFYLGTLLNLACSVEGGLLTIFTAMRDVVLISTLALIGSLVPRITSFTSYPRRMNA